MSNTMQAQSTRLIANISRRMIQEAATVVGPHRHPKTSPCDVFINHRGIDTKRNVAGLLYHHLLGHGLRPFLDSKSMKPGDRLFNKIDEAIRECKVGMAVLSPMYCDSYFCLHELSLMMETRKRVVPIFCDVKPSELVVKDDGTRSEKDLDRFKSALQEAKYTVGLKFDTTTGDWPEFLTKATNAVMRNLVEVGEEDDVTTRKIHSHPLGSRLS